MVAGCGVAGVDGRAGGIGCRLGDGVGTGGSSGGAATFLVVGLALGSGAAALPRGIWSHVRYSSVPSPQSAKSLHIAHVRQCASNAA